MNEYSVSGTIDRLPELRYTPQQTPVCTTYVKFLESAYGEPKYPTIKVVAFGQRADELHDFSVGDSVYIEGGVRMNKVDTEAGRRTIPEIMMSSIELIQASPAPTPETYAPDTEEYGEVTAAQPKQDYDDLPF